MKPALRDGCHDPQIPKTTATKEKKVARLGNTVATKMCLPSSNSWERGRLSSGPGSAGSKRIYRYEAANLAGFDVFAFHPLPVRIDALPMNS
ncbi:hypothetical protein ON010_g4358 [Phytophthora cinnamomi]|nr:hypothetical protein ON010_g4358 [Phytophthora cinnamomi]